MTREKTGRGAEEQRSQGASGTSAHVRLRAPTPLLAISLGLLTVAATRFRILVLEGWLPGGLAVLGLLGLAVGGIRRLGG